MCSSVSHTSTERERNEENPERGEIKDKTRRREGMRVRGDLMKTEEGQRNWEREERNKKGPWERREVLRAAGLINTRTTKRDWGQGLRRTSNIQSLGIFTETRQTMEKYEVDFYTVCSKKPCRKYNMSLVKMHRILRHRKYSAEND